MGIAAAATMGFVGDVKEDSLVRVVVIGASGMIGREVHKQLSERHETVGCARTSGDFRVDIRSGESIRDLFESLGPVNAVVCAAGDAVFKPMMELTDDEYALGFSNKLMAQANLVRIGHRYLLENGSFTLTSGVTARQPIPGTTSYAMVNGGIESFVRAAALELPRGIRINAVSPQWVNATLEMYGMDPAWGVPVELSGRGYVESVEGSRTGTVIDSGWRYDWTADSVAVASR
jgi:NAD(P)-dependent dehydrogenase (short-subunit alcohol dehydrogenase family)